LEEREVKCIIMNKGDFSGVVACIIGATSVMGSV
jgi:hypothetical protein